MLQEFIEKIKNSFLGSSSRRHIGISLHENSIVVVVGVVHEQNWHYSTQHKFECSDKEQWQAVLAEKVMPVLNKNDHIYLSIPPGSYQVLQIEKPNVPEEEIEGAIPWLVKDLVSVPQEKIVCDFYYSPVKIPMQPEKVTIVVSNLDLIETLVSTVNNAGMNLCGIYAQEFCLPQLCGNTDSPVLVLTQLQRQEPCVQIIKGGQVHFSRWLRGFSRICDYTEEEIRAGLAESVGLEIQRSMDYYQSQLKQGQIKEMLIELDSEHQKVIVNLLASSFQLPVKLLTFDHSKVSLSSNTETESRAGADVEGMSAEANVSPEAESSSFSVSSKAIELGAEASEDTLSEVYQDKNLYSAFGAVLSWRSIEEQEL